MKKLIVAPICLLLASFVQAVQCPNITAKPYKYAELVIDGRYEWGISGKVSGTTYDYGKTYANAPIVPVVNWQKASSSYRYDIYNNTPMCKYKINDNNSVILTLEKPHEHYRYICQTDDQELGCATNTFILSAIIDGAN